MRFSKFLRTIATIMYIIQMVSIIFVYLLTSTVRRVYKLLRLSTRSDIQDRRYMHQLQAQQAHALPFADTID